MSISQGFSLSEHSLMKEDGSEVICSTEQKLYKELGLPWIPPEIREDRGEIAAAINGEIPNLLERTDIIAELHCHSTWSDGKMSILEMAKAAVEQGYKVLAITDHSKSLGIGNGLSLQRLIEQKMIRLSTP